MAYYAFKDEETGAPFGSCEVFHASANQLIEWEWVQPDGDGGWTRNVGYGPERYELSELVGWYWQACFPGCLPDGEPMGPFLSEADAIADADLLV